MSELSVAAALAAATAIMADNPLCFLLTTSATGQIDARVMQPFAPGDDFALWFGTSPASRKVRDVGHSPAATVAFQSKDGSAYVTLTGTVDVRTDLETRRAWWREDWRAFFPGGAEGDDFVVLAFTTDRVEVLDFVRHIAPPPFGLTAAALVRADAGWVFASDA